MVSGQGKGIVTSSLVIGKAFESWFTKRRPFCTPDGGDVEQDPQMAGQPYPSGVKDPVTIDEHELRHSVEFGVGMDKWRCFPEGQEACYVRVGHWTLDDRLVDHGAPQALRDDDGGEASLSASRIGYVSACDLPWFSRKRADLH